MLHGYVILLFVVISCAANVSIAQSVYIGETDKKVLTVDAGTVREKVGYVQAWVEYNDVQLTQKSGSIKSLMRFRCSEEEIASASAVSYSKPYGSGDVISSSNTSYPQYVPVVPGTVGDSVLKFVCAYKANEPWAHALVQATIDAERVVRSAAAEDAAEKAASAAMDAAVRAAGNSEAVKVEKPATGKEKP